MFGFPWMFWLLPFLFFLVFTRHWRHGGWAQARRGPDPRLAHELDQHRDYVDRLERRVVDLEERLDFTERLLARRNQEAAGPV
jgi:hypothetical protein